MKRFFFLLVTHGCWRNASMKRGLVYQWLPVLHILGIPDDRCNVKTGRDRSWSTAWWWVDRLLAEDLTCEFNLINVDRQEKKVTLERSDPQIFEFTIFSSQHSWSTFLFTLFSSSERCSGKFITLWLMWRLVHQPGKEKRMKLWFTWLMMYRSFKRQDNERNERWVQRCDCHPMWIVSWDCDSHMVVGSRCVSKTWSNILEVAFNRLMPRMLD